MNQEIKETVSSLAKISGALAFVLALVDSMYVLKLSRFVKNFTWLYVIIFTIYFVRFLINIKFPSLKQHKGE